MEGKLFFSIVCPILITLHMLNSIMIITKKRLRKPQYYFLVNLSISDILLLLIILICEHILRTDVVDVVRGVITIFVTSTILSTLALTLDRYIAVKYCLRYAEIMTPSRVIQMVISIWIPSILLAAIPHTIGYSTREERKLISDCIHVPLYFIFIAIFYFISIVKPIFLILCSI